MGQSEFSRILARELAAQQQHAERHVEMPWQASVSPLLFQNEIKWTPNKQRSQQFYKPTPPPIVIYIWSVQSQVAMREISQQLQIEIPENISPEQLKKIYRQTLKKIHPDILGNLAESVREQANHRFVHINALFQICLKEIPQRTLKRDSKKSSQR